MGKQSFSKQNFQLETRDILNVEIFAAGKWNGAEFEEKDLDQMVKNFREKVSDIFVTIDHDPEMTEETKRVLGAVSLGWVEKMWRDGKKLLANISQVPGKIAELIEAGALKQKSIELWFDYAVNGKSYNNVIDGVTFTGRIPAVNTLADALVLYKQEPRAGTQTGVRMSMAKESNMDEITIKKTEYDALLSDKAQAASFKKEADTQKAEFERVVSELETTKAEYTSVKTERDALAEFKKTAMEEKKVAADASAEAFVADQVKAGKLLPKFAEFTKKQLLSLEGEDLSTFKAEIEERKPSMYVQDTGAGTGAAGEEVRTEDLSDDLDSKVRAAMTKEGLEPTTENYVKTAQKLGLFETAAKE